MVRAGRSPVLPEPALESDDHERDGAEQQQRDRDRQGREAALRVGGVVVEVRLPVGHELPVCRVQRRHPPGLTFLRGGRAHRGVVLALGVLVRDRRVCLDELVERSLKCAALWEEVKDRLNKPGLGLSGGQQQRLVIARALAVSPAVILMDEPCSALDPQATLRIEELISELKSRYTIVIVTHNMQQAARVADSTAFMLNGENLSALLTRLTREFLDQDN